MRINQKQAALIGLAASVVLAMPGCEIHQEEPITTVYGPPVQQEVHVGSTDISEAPEKAVTEDKNTQNAVTDPADIEPIEVYGPPVSA